MMLTSSINHLSLGKIILINLHSDENANEDNTKVVDLPRQNNFKRNESKENFDGLNHF